MRSCFWIAVLFITNIQCQMAQKDNINPVTVEKTLTLDTLPSGSGIAVVDESVFIVGDDSPWLFQLSADLEIENRYLLMSGFPTEGRIPKAVKPDFECMAEAQEGESTILLIFGSGSKSPERDILVKVDTRQLDNPEVISLTTFYNHLLSLSGGTRADLNMEAALVIGAELYLFNRGDNRIFVLDWKSLLENLADEQALQELDIRQYVLELPDREGIKAGFSGACSGPDKNKIIFTATLEATDNWIADGEILGSFLGVLDVDMLQEGKVERVSLVEDVDGLPIKDKLESVAIRNIDANGDVLMLAVADNDDGTSRLLELQVDGSFLKGAAGE